MDWFRKAVTAMRAKGGVADTRFTLADAEKLRDADPRTFSIPRGEQRRALKVGDTAKIMLELAVCEGPFSSERLWVQIVEVVGGRYRARIDNSPVLLPDLDDAVLDIGPEHVISVMLPDEYVLPNGKSCRVSAAIVDRDAWPQRLRRVAPEAAHDSGWRIWAEGETADAADRLVGCDEAMSHFMVLDSVLDEPALAAWRWNPADNEYVRDAG